MSEHLSEAQTLVEDLAVALGKKRGDVLIDERPGMRTPKVFTLTWGPASGRTGNLVDRAFVKAYDLAHYLWGMLDMQRLLEEI